MRDPRRIADVITELAIYWQRYPDLRLMQIFGNVAQHMHAVPSPENPIYAHMTPLVDSAVYNIEDDRVLALLRMYNSPGKADGS